MWRMGPNHSGINPTHSNKVVPMYACTEKRPRCLVYLLYSRIFSKFPPKAKEMDVFYLQPKPRICGDDFALV